MDNKHDDKKTGFTHPDAMSHRGGVRRILMPNELWKEAAERARAKGISTSEFIRRAIAAALRKKKGP